MGFNMATMSTFFAENWEPISQDHQNDFEIEIFMALISGQ